MNGLVAYDFPKLNNPTLIVAMRGWNDASRSATFAVSFLVNQWNARKIAEIDPEDYFDFSEVRPKVRIIGRSQRMIEWPANEFFVSRDVVGQGDLVFMLGTEPQLKWKSFSRAIIHYVQQLGVHRVICTGALVADVMHSEPVHLSGTSNDSALTRRLRHVGVLPTHYEGPTGILGVLNAEAATAGMQAGSIWGSVPNYLSATPNYTVASAILRRLRELLTLQVDLTEIELLDREFVRRVEEVVAENPEIADYIRSLGAASHRAEDSEAATSRDPLPSSEDIISDVEDFFRRRSGPDLDDSQGT